MSQGGVTPEDVATLAEAPKWERAINYIDAVERQVQADRERVKALVDTALGIDNRAFHGGHGIRACSRLSRKVAEAQTAMAAALDPVLGLLDQLDGSRAAVKLEFGLEHRGFLVLYEQAKARQAEHRALIEENEKLASQLQVAVVEQDRAAAAYAATLPRWSGSPSLAASSPASSASAMRSSSGRPTKSWRNPAAS